MFRRLGPVTGLLLVMSSCGAHDAAPCASTVPASEPPPTASAEAIVDVAAAPPRVVYAVSDIHGGYDRLMALLANNEVIAGVPSSPDAVAWAAGDAVLVVAGDLIDKGPQPLEVIDALRALEASASRGGGRVIVLLGNHEAEFLADPTNKKASASDGVDRELAAKGLDCGLVAAGGEPRGAWLRARPLGARVGGWFYSHAGNTKNRSLAVLDDTLRRALSSPARFADPEIIGSDSILEARDWYADPAVVRASAASLGVAHFVFGHDPNALGPRGSIAFSQEGLVVRIDCGMSPDVDDSSGCLLRVRRDGVTEVAEQLKADGQATLLFRTPSAP
ncbi:MAG: putative serine/threonine phosphatase [Labilithrix sp.]|nr:putative serine/threonine phosphatase [Labilithrix sp.]